MRYDAFPIAGTPNELLLLECRLTELYDVVDAFIVVEADVDHQNHPKPWNYLDNADRFAAWKDKICYVQASGLPNSPHVANPWARENAQREWIGKGLEQLEAEPDDIILQSDLDEIPNRVTARNVNPQRNAAISFHQKAHFWAVDWLYPPGWNGTVACRVGALEALGKARNGPPFSSMRDSRNTNKQIVGGWHFSWLGGTPEAWLRKVNSFCHPEVEERIVQNAARYFAEGAHVDGVQMVPCEVDRTYPKWMQDPSNVPDSWRRPR